MPAPTITGGKVTTGQSDAKTIEEAIERGELDHDLRQFLDELTGESEGLAQVELQGDIESVDDLPDEVLENIDELSAEQLHRLPDDVLDELPDEVTADLNYDMDYEELVGDDIDWDAHTMGDDPHPESVDAQQAEQLEEARQEDDRSTFMESKSPSETGHPEMHGDANERMTLEERAAELADSDTQSGITSDGQPLETAPEAQGDGNESMGAPEVDTAQSGEARGTGSDTGQWVIKQGNLKVKAESDAAGMRLKQALGADADAEEVPDWIQAEARDASAEEIKFVGLSDGKLIVERQNVDGEVIEWDSTEFIDMTDSRVPLAEQDIDLETAFQEGLVLPRPEGADTVTMSAIAGREASIEQTREMVFDVVNEEFEGIDANHLGQLTEAQREQVAERITEKMQASREMTSADDWSSETSGVPPEPADDPPMAPDDDRARWFKSHQELADFEPERTDSPTESDVELFQELMDSEQKQQAIQQAKAIADQPNAPSSGEVYDKMVTAMTAGASPDEAQAMVQRELRGCNVINDDEMTRQIGDDPVVTPATYNEIRDLREHGVEHATVRGAVVEAREGKSGDWQWAKIKGGEGGSVTLRIHENTNVQTPVQEGDIVRVSNVQPDKTVTDDGRTYEEVAATGLSRVDVVGKTEDAKIMEEDPEAEDRSPPPTSGPTPRGKGTGSKMKNRKLPNALGADSPTSSSRRADEGGASTIDRRDTNRSKTPDRRHTASEDAQQRESLTRSRADDPEGERPSEQPTEFPAADRQHPARGGRPESADELFHDCGSLMKVHASNGAAHCTNCGGIETKATATERVDNPDEELPDLESGLQSELSSSLNKQSDSVQPHPRKSYSAVLNTVEAHPNDEVDLETVAGSVIAQEKKTSRVEISAAGRREATDDLVETILPEMEDAGLIRFDPDSGTVSTPD